MSTANKLPIYIECKTPAFRRAAVKALLAAGCLWCDGDSSAESGLPSMEQWKDDCVFINTSKRMSHGKPECENGRPRVTLSEALHILTCEPAKPEPVNPPSFPVHIVTENEAHRAAVIAALEEAGYFPDNQKGKWTDFPLLILERTRALEYQCVTGVDRVPNEVTGPAVGIDLALEMIESARACICKTCPTHGGKL